MFVTQLRRYLERGATVKRYRVSQFHAEQAQGHERQSIDWIETLPEPEARLLLHAPHGLLPSKLLDHIT